MERLAESFCCLFFCHQSPSSSAGGGSLKNTGRSPKMHCFIRSCWERRDAAHFQKGKNQWKRNGAGGERQAQGFRWGKAAGRLSGLVSEIIERQGSARKLVQHRCASIKQQIAQRLSTRHRFAQVFFIHKNVVCFEFVTRIFWSLFIV